MLSSKSFVLPAPPESPRKFRAAAKCYTWNTSDTLHATEGFTLILAHCIGAHKEQWEPFLEKLFTLCNDSGRSNGVRIREAWAIDRPNHADSVPLNEGLFGNVKKGCTVQDIIEDQPGGASVYDWSPSITHLLKSDRLRGHKIVGIGHSAGAGTIILSLKNLPPHARAQIKSLILVEPSLVTQSVFHSALEDRMTQMELAFGATSMRRDSWTIKGDEKCARKELAAWMMARFPWNGWNERVVKSYADYGFRVTERSTKGTTFTLKTPKAYEAVSFVDTAPHFEATDMLGSLCSTLKNVHVVFGQEEEFMPEWMKHSLCDPQEGRKMKSVTTIERCGHMLVQERPDEVARIVSELLHTDVPLYASEKPSIAIQSKL